MSRHASRAACLGAGPWRLLHVDLNSGVCTGELGSQRQSVPHFSLNRTVPYSKNNLEELESIKRKSFVEEKAA